MLARLFKKIIGKAVSFVRVLFAYFKKPGVSRRLFSAALAIAILLGIPTLSFEFDGVSYNRPEKIAPIDSSDSSVDYSTWFSGYDISNVVLTRYDGYGLTGGADNSAILGLEDTPYIIENGLEMQYLAQLVNAGNKFTNEYIRIKGSLKAGSALTNPVIDLVVGGGILYLSGATTVSWVRCDFNNNNSIGWTPIGNTSSNYFDGNIYADTNVKIYNLSANVTGASVFGLFGYLGPNAVIDNIDLVDTQLYFSGTSKCTIGGIVGQSNNDATITNCSVKGVTPGTRSATADGSSIIVGTTAGTYEVPDFTIRTNGTKSVVGGIIGNVSRGMTITDSEIDINVVTRAGCGLGGIAGYVSNFSGTPLTVSGVTGEFIAKTENTGSSSMYRVGGVIGEIGTAPVIINNVGSSTTPYSVCLEGRGYSDNGAKGTYGGFAGIVGYSSSASLEIGSSTLPCYVSPEFRLNKYSTNNNFYAGGIVGRSKGSATATLDIKYCNVVDMIFSKYAVTSDNTPRMTVGGILGSMDTFSPNTSATYCTVTNADISADGFVGGIVGMGSTMTGSLIALISHCDVIGLTITQSATVVTGGNYSIVGGIAAALDATAAIEYSTVRDFEVNFIMTSPVGSYNYFGGIVGRADGTGITIDSCASEVAFNVAAYNNNQVSGVFVGGAAAYSAGVTMTNTAAAVDLNIVTTSIENTIEVETLTISAGTVLQNFVAGGLIGIAADKATSVTDCYAGGDIDCGLPDGKTLGNRQSAIGGLIGAITSTVTMSDCFSTTSLDGNLEDAIGGLVGFNRNLSTSVTGCHYGGALLNPFAASIVYYTSGGTFTGNSHNPKYSPNAPSAVDSITATATETIPATVSTVDADFNTLCRGFAALAAADFTGNHVFAVTSTLTGGAASEIKEYSTTINNITVKNRVRLVKNQIDNAQNGLSVPFTIDTAADLTNMRLYVANGGGFLGSQFALGVSVTSTLSAPIGSASADLKNAETDNEPFCGIFDGNGNTITRSTTMTSATYNGLFGYIQNAEIKDLKVVYTGAIGIPSTVSSGGLVGYAAYSDIGDIYVNATTGITLNGTAVGGVIGYAKSTVVNKGSSEYGSFSGKLVGLSNTGGIIGEASNAKPTYNVHDAGGSNFFTDAVIYTYSAVHNTSVSRCYTAGDIIGRAGNATATTGVNPDNTAENVGGIIGKACGGNSQVDNSFMFGNVTGGHYVGGLVGYLTDPVGSGYVVNSYTNGDIYANDFAGGLVGFIHNANSVTPIIVNGYYVGQIECNGSLAAACPSESVALNFYYDSQVAGDIAVTGSVEDDSEIEVTGASLLTKLGTDTAGLSIVSYSKAVTAQDITTSPSNNTTYTYTDTSVTPNMSATVKLGASNNIWTYTAADNRFALKNTSGTNGYFEVTFTGTYFSLQDYISGGHDAYRVYVDGEEVLFNANSPSVVLTTSLKQYTQPLYDGEAAVVTYISKPDHTTGNTTGKAYLAYVSNDAGLANGAIYSSFGVTGLAMSQHTIKIVGVQTKSNSYMNIRGFTYGWNLDSDFSTTATNYPQIRKMNTKFPTVSDLSTEYIYNFSNSIDRSSHNFRNNSTVDAATNAATAATYTCNKDATELAALGVEEANDIFTCNTATVGGTFTLTSNRTVDGYSLNINEKIIVVQFELGSGMADDPFQIRNVKELSVFRDYINTIYNGSGQHFKLTMTTTTPAHSAAGVIYDMSGTDQSDDTFTQAVDEWTPIGIQDSSFSGTFDGNGKVITNMNITTAARTDDWDYAGLFGYVNDAAIKNVTVGGSIDLTTSLAKRNCIGLVAIAAESEISNIRSQIDYDVVLNVNNTNYVNIGGAVGYASDSTVSGVLSEPELAITSSKNINSDLITVGGIIGCLAPTEPNSDSLIDQCVSNVKLPLYGGTYTYRACAGGIIGRLVNMTNGGEVTVSNCGSYGNYYAARGYLGGIIGFANVSTGYNLTLDGNISTASLTMGSSNTDSYVRVGGLIGYTDANEYKLTLNDNIYGGEMNTIDNGKFFYKGGLIGYNSALIEPVSWGNYYDVTKNPEVKLTGSTGIYTRDLFGEENVAYNSEKMTYQLIDENGSYAEPALTAETNFGSTANLVDAGKIIDGNSISLNLVRIDPVYKEAKTNKYPSLSSAFISSASDASLQISNYSASSAYYKSTTSNKRVVSYATSDSEANAITVKVVLLDENNIDTLGGYGKELTYTPSVEAIGKTDASYLCANPEGDSISDTGVTFTLYNADQLMGLDPFVMLTDHDDFGNRIYTTLSDDYEIYLANDINVTGIDYLSDDDTSRTYAIGDSTHSFTGTLDGQYHTIYGLMTSSDAEVSPSPVGLFASLNGAAVQNVGITDSTFILNSAGSVGSFGGTASNTTFTDSFSSARVEQSNATPSGVFSGGFVGSGGGLTVNNSFFTGSVGITPVDNATYTAISGTGDYFSGGFAGKLTADSTFTSSYVASYVHGDVTADADAADRTHNIGQFVGKGGDFVTLTTCSVDYQAGAESCSALGDKPSVTVTSLEATGGYYPSKWDEGYQTTREKAARIAGEFSTAASSMSRVDIANGALSKSDYDGSLTVWGAVGSEIYAIDTQYATRANSGISSILFTLTEDGVTSSRVVVMNLQCWYDNFVVDAITGYKTYTLKNAADLEELAQMVFEATDENVGHGHSVAHTGTGIASDRFATATIKLGANLNAAGEVISTIGKTPATAFAGTFDGNGYTISNAHFESASGAAGLIGYLTADAVVENVMMAGDSTITVAANETGEVSVGGIVADYTTGTVRNCSNGANITITNNSDQDVYIGGVVGKVGAGKTVTGCYNMGHLLAATDGMNISGIAGQNLGTITKCYNTGIIDGFSNEASTTFVPQSAVSGICAVNSGTVGECYNSGILRFYNEDKLFPIASGTVTDSYVNGQYFTPQYNFVGNIPYSTGVNILSNADMSDGAEFSNTWTGWTYIDGYYPQFSYLVDPLTGVGGSRKVSSTVSSLAGNLSARANSGVLATYDCFGSIKFDYGDTAFTVVENEGNLGTFTRDPSTGALRLTVYKRGVAEITLNRTSGDMTFSRLLYYINEETFVVRYTFDFSELTADTTGHTTARFNGYPLLDANGDVTGYDTTTNTFANAATRDTYGTGSAGNPYLINTAADLTALAAYIADSRTGGYARHFKLINNIDCTGLQWTPIGTEEKPFDGTLNGNGHIISGITSNACKYNGLIGCAGENSIVEVIGLENSKFYVQTGNAAGSWTGALAGYSDGVISNCYSRAVVNIPDSSSGVMYVGGLVGELGQTGSLRGCYARPASQTGSFVPAGSNTIDIYTTSPDLVCGILVGKTSGLINGCYHTSVYYSPSGYTGISEYGIVVGHYAAGMIKNTYYDRDVLPSENSYLYLEYGDTGIGALPTGENPYGKTTDELKVLEDSAASLGVANDSAALRLSTDLCLGTYQMTPLPHTITLNSSYTNDGYPMLTAFDIAQYKFAYFDTSNIILCMQNIDASNAKLMNALCAYENFDFPIYAEITAKTRLNVNVFSLPKTMSFNVSAVGYGIAETGEVKWVVVNGDYTESRNLHDDQYKEVEIYDDLGNITTETVFDSAGNGSGMVDNTNNVGPISIVMGITDCLPNDCNRIYVYITLQLSETPDNEWGVYHDWDSSSLEELPDETEAD